MPLTAALDGEAPLREHRDAIDEATVSTANLLLHRSVCGKPGAVERWRSSGGRGRGFRLQGAQRCAALMVSLVARQLLGDGVAELRAVSVAAGVWGSEKGFGRNGRVSRWPEAERPGSHGITGG